MDRTQIRLGVLGFPISGSVAAVAAFVPGIGINPATDPAGFARAANDVALANLAGLVALVLLLFGFQALHGFLSNTPMARWSTLGMTLSVAGEALYAPFLGIFAFAAPAAGRSYLSGQVQAISIISEATSLSNPTAVAFGGTSILLYVLGSVLFSTAIWQSGKLPKWTAVAYSIATPLNVAPHYIPAIWFVGAILLLGSGLGIVWNVWKTVR